MEQNKKNGWSKCQKIIAIILGCFAIIGGIVGVTEYVATAKGLHDTKVELKLEIDKLEKEIKLVGKRINKYILQDERFQLTKRIYYLKTIHGEDIRRWPPPTIEEYQWIIHRIKQIDSLLGR